MNRFAAFTRTTALVASLVVSSLTPAWAQFGGDKPVRLIVPLTAGSTVDIVARDLGPELTRTMGRPVVIENLPGAGGMTGTLQVVRGPKDGSTLGMISSNHVINPSIYKSMPYDAIKDITPIMVIGTVPLVLVVHPSVQANNLKELIALVKAKPGALNYGSAGNGSVLQLAAEMFKSEAGGLDIHHVPYRGTGPLVTDLLGGQVQMGFVSVAAAAPLVKAGKLRAIGVSTKTRSNTLPNTPTLAEQGLPNYSFDAWLALIGPAGMPAATVQRIAKETKAALSGKPIQDKLEAQGITLSTIPPEATTEYFKTELDKHTKLVKQAGASVN